MNKQIRDETASVVALDKAIMYTKDPTFKKQYKCSQVMIIDEALKGIEKETIKNRGLYPRVEK